MTGNNHRRSWGSIPLFASLKAAVTANEHQDTAKSSTTQLPGRYGDSCGPEVDPPPQQSNSPAENPRHEIQPSKSHFWRFNPRHASADKLMSNQKPVSKPPNGRNSENGRRPSWKSIRRFSPANSSDRGSGTELQSDRSHHSIKKGSISGPVLTSTTNIKIAATEGVNATPLRLGEISGSPDSKDRKENDSGRPDGEDQISPGRQKLARFRNTFSGSFLLGDYLNGQSKQRDSGAVELSGSGTVTPTFEKGSKRRSSHLFSIGKEKINNLADSCGIRHASLSLRRENVNHPKRKSWSSAVKTSESNPFGDSMRELLSQSLPRRRSLLQHSFDDLSLEKSFADAVDKLDFLDSREDFKTAPASGAITANGVPPFPRGCKFSNTSSDANDQSKLPM